MVREQHPIQNLEIILKYAEKLEWSVCTENITKPCWARIKCNTLKLPNSTMSIWLLPHYPQIHAKQIIKNLKGLNVKKRIGIILINDEKHKLYEFTFKLHNIHYIDDNLETNIYHQVGEDILIHSIENTVYLHCSRGADNLEQAVDLVIADLYSAGYQFELMSHATLMNENKTELSP